MRIKFEFNLTRERDERSKFDSLIDAAMHLYPSVFGRRDPEPMPDLGGFNGRGGDGQRPA